MNKEDTLDLIIKAFGVYLLVLAILAIPSVLQGLSAITFYLYQRPWEDSGADANEMREMMNTLQTNMLFSGLGSLFKFAICLLAARNFLRSGSWVKWVMRNKKAEQGAAE